MDVETATPIEEPEPPDPDVDAPLGEIRSPDGEKVEQRVRVTTGRGQWAYWISASTQLRVVADTIYNPHAPHFAGFLPKVHPGGKPRDAWLVVHGWVAPPPEKRIYVEDEDQGKPRMERREND